MADNVNIAYKTTAGSGETLLAPATDDIGGVLYQRVKPAHGADGSATDVSAASPMPAREPTRSAALTHGGVTATTTSSTLIASNGSRTMLEVSNGDGTNGVWLRFAAAASVAGTGAFLAPGSSGYWYYSGEVRVISAAGSVAVGYVEW